MPKVTARRPGYRNLGELLEQLGNIPPQRVCTDPFPGTATKRDLIRLHSREDKLYELVDRTLVEKPTGSPEAFIAAELIWLFRNYLSGNDLGFLYAPDVLIEVMPNLVRGPDVCFVSWSKRPDKTVPTEPISDLIPDLAVEILSPSNTSKEIARKLAEYFTAGVGQVWVIDPAKRSANQYTEPGTKVTVTEAGTLDGGDVLPGFRLPLAKLFERLAKPTKRKPRKK